MMGSPASTRPSSAASACSTASLIDPVLSSPAVSALRQIVRPIHAGSITHATMEGVARRDT
jgi:hypothetical protein